MASGVGHFVSRIISGRNEYLITETQGIMNEEDMQRILKDLEDRGFDDGLLRWEVESKEALNLPAFTINREKNFGEDRMFYRLFFQWTEAIMGFELKAIHANHRMPVDIDRKFINGVDSIQLDKEMSGIDWGKHWETMLKNQVVREDSDQTADCIDSICQLLLHEAADVNLVGEQLMYKHWPPEYLPYFQETRRKSAVILSMVLPFPLIPTPTFLQTWHI